MKVWITKYALTAGVFGTEAVQPVSGRMVVVKARPGCGSNGVEYFHGRDWHTSHSDAIDQAEDMRDAKIKSLRKQIAKLEALEFRAEERASQ